MIISFEGITLEYNSGEHYAHIYMPTRADPVRHAVDCLNMQDNPNPPELYLYLALKDWVRENYATVYVNQ